MTAQKKNTLSQYNMDFKFSYKDIEYNLSDFRRYTHWVYSGPNHDRTKEQNDSRFDAMIAAEFYPDLYNTQVDKGDWRTKWSVINYEERQRLISTLQPMKDAVAAFEKWAKKRHGLIEVFNSYYDGQTSDDWGKLHEKLEFNMFNLASKQYDRAFNCELEKSRPVKFNGGELVTLGENTRFGSWDPFRYSEIELRDKPRIGMVVQSSDQTSGRSGKGSRLIRVLWMASGETTGVPVRLLKRYTRESEGIVT